MPTRLAQSSSHASGTAGLQISGPALAQFPVAEFVEIAILQAGSVERFLDPRNPTEPWTTAVYWFRPVFAKREGAALSLEIDYGVTFHLRANQPYTLRLRDQLSLSTLEERFTGPVSMRRPSAPPEGWVPPPDPSGPVGVPHAPVSVAAVSELSAAPVEPELPDMQAVQPVASAVDENEVVQTQGSSEESANTPVSRKARLVALAAVGFVLVVAVAGWLLYSPTRDEAIASGSSDADATLANVRKLIASGPDTVQVREKADELAKAGKLLDGQFLLYKYASEKGDSVAALAMGSFYDPDLWEKTKSPMPASNPLEAAKWYKQGADAGDSEAAYRYAMLLKKGRTDEVSAEEQAVVWLRKAAASGHIKAKQELGQ